MCVSPARWSAAVYYFHHLGVFDVAFCLRLPVCGCWRKAVLADVSAVFLLCQAGSDSPQVRPSGKDILGVLLVPGNVCLFNWLQIDVLCGVITGICMCRLCQAVLCWKLQVKVYLWMDDTPCYFLL